MVNQAQRREATIAAILRVARALFGKRGFAATSIDRIAADSGLAKGAVYHHFASKEALFTAVLEAVQADVAKSPVPASATRLTDPLDQIAAGVLHYLLATNEPDTRRILLIDGPTVDRLAEVARNRRTHLRRRRESGHRARTWSERQDRAHRRHRAPVDGLSDGSSARMREFAAAEGAGARVCDGASRDAGRRARRRSLLEQSYGKSRSLTHESRDTQRLNQSVSAGSWCSAGSRLPSMRSPSFGWQIVAATFRSANVNASPSR